MGDRVICAETAAEALDAFRNQCPDVVLCDFHLPELDGLQLIRIMKSTKPWVRCVLVTGDLDAKLTAEKLGPDAILAKPWSEEALREAVTTGAAWSRAFNPAR